MPVENTIFPSWGIGIQIFAGTLASTQMDYYKYHYAYSQATEGSIEIPTYRIQPITSDAIRVSDSPSRPDRTTGMSDTPTHREIDARLEVISAQTDAKFERVLGEMRATNATLAGRFNTIEVKVDAAKAAAQEASNRTLTTRWQFFALMLALFGAVVGVAGLIMSNTSYITGMVQALESVRNTATPSSAP
jgi:hypothetical protein